MPLPFLLIGLFAAGGTTLFGAATKAVNDDFEVEINQINHKTRALVAEAKAEYRLAKKQAEASIEELVGYRAGVYRQSLGGFVRVFGMLKSVDLQEIVELSTELADFVDYTLSFKDNSSGRDVVPLGYGELSAQGAALGALLGGVYVVGNLFKGVKLAHAVDEANANYAKVKAEAESVRTAKAAFTRIRSRVYELSEVTRALDVRFGMALAELDRIIWLRGADYSTYSQTEKQQVYVTVQLASALKVLLEAPVVTSEGRLDRKSKAAMTKARVIMGALVSL